MKASLGLTMRWFEMKFTSDVYNGIVAFDPHLRQGSQVKKAVFAMPLTQVTGGQRPPLTLVKYSTPLTLVKGGAKVLPNLTLGQRYFWLRSKLLLTLTRVKACQRRYQRCCLPLTTVAKIVVHLCLTFDANQRWDKANYSCSVLFTLEKLELHLRSNKARLFG